MCALCALGFRLKEFFGLGGLFFRRAGVFVVGGGPGCGEGTAAGNVSKSGYPVPGKVGCLGECSASVIEAIMSAAVSAPIGTDVPQGCVPPLRGLIILL